MSRPDEGPRRLEEREHEVRAEERAAAGPLGACFSWPAMSTQGREAALTRFSL